MTTSSVTATVTTTAGTVRPTAATITLDARWSPHVECQVTIPDTAAQRAALDPLSTTPARLVLTLVQTWATNTTLAARTAEWTGKTFAQLSTEWTGKTLAALSDQWGDRLGNATWRAPQTLTADLTVRSVARDLASGLLTITATSDERIAQDAAGLASPRVPEPWADRLAALLAAAGLTPPGIVVDPLLTTATGIAPERTATVWDALDDSATAAGARLWCDEARVWHADTVGVFPPFDAPQHTWDRIIAGEVTASRDDWHDAVRAWAGATVVDLPDPATIGTHRTYVHDDGQDAEALSVRPDLLLESLTATGRVATITAPIDVATRPGRWLNTTAGTGVIQSVRHELPAATTTATTRAFQGA